MYLLDANICVALMNDPGGPQMARRWAARSSGRPVQVSSIVVFELQFGAENSDRVAANTTRLAALLADGLTIVDFAADDARAAAAIRADLRRKGTPIGPYDVLIAGQALARGATLVTANTSEFARVDGLVWEDWAA